jgi:hypothetical protein
MNENTMSVDASQEDMWTLSEDRKTVRFDVPSVSIPGLAEPLRIQLDFDAEGVDEVLKRLIVLRAKMPETH